ncbi:MAG: nitrous oxide-stimulated promoter family protein [Burkholderiales bacterium]|nr:nitrous oxide-stimulated promoter family protein [Burkholderiales bacterium]
MAHELSPKRLEKLKDSYIANEVKTIRIMSEIYCHDHHLRQGSQNLCDECQDFVDYATKRLACCPYGASKPVCNKCKIHCFQKDYKTLAKKIMAYSGPRLLWTHPILAMRHVVAMFRKAPDKPRISRSKNLSRT